MTGENKEGPTTGQVTKVYPFLEGMFNELGWLDQDRVSVLIGETSEVLVQDPISDVMTREVTGGLISTEGIAWSGMFDPESEYETLLFKQGVHGQHGGKVLDEGCWFAVCDSFEDYDVREVTLWLNPDNGPMLPEGDGEGEVRSPRYGTFQGHTVISIPLGREGYFSFGLTKAKALLAYLDDIKVFVSAASGVSPKGGEIF